MPSVDDTVRSEDLGRTIDGERRLVLDVYWESWYGGLASVAVRRITEKPNGDIDVEDLFYEEIPAWRDGDFSSKEVLDRFGAKFNRILAKERRLAQQFPPRKQQKIARRRGPVDVKSYYKNGKKIEAHTRKAPRRVR